MKKLPKLHIGVVVPVLSAFPQFAKCLASVHSDMAWWQPYIGKQWEHNLAISTVWNLKSLDAFGDGCDYVVILNDDVQLNPWTVDAMIYELKRNPDLHLVSGESTHLPEQVVQAEPLKKSNLNFSCFMITPELFELAGLFDENFYPAYFEDNDMHYRMQLLDLPAYGIKDGQFYHEGSVTTNIQKEQVGYSVFENFEKNRSYYISKWGGVPGEERFQYPFDDPKLTPKDWQ